MRYIHDCGRCKPLGEFNDADLYYCYSILTGEPIVIARYSDDGRDYQSGVVFADIIPELAEAKKRAIELGHMT